MLADPSRHPLAPRAATTSWPSRSVKYSSPASSKSLRRPGKKRKHSPRRRCRRSNVEFPVSEHPAHGTPVHPGRIRANAELGPRPISDSAGLALLQAPSLGTHPFEHSGPMPESRIDGANVVQFHKFSEDRYLNASPEPRPRNHASARSALDRPARHGPPKRGAASGR